MSLPPIKCVVVGDGMVGKTWMMSSVTENNVPGDYVPTVFDNYTVTATVEGYTCGVHLFEESCDHVRTFTYPQTDVFMICFSVVFPSSFSNVKIKWVPSISHNSAPLLIVGTKVDLRDDKATIDEEGETSNLQTRETTRKGYVCCWLCRVLCPYEGFPTFLSIL